MQFTCDPGHKWLCTAHSEGRLRAGMLFGSTSWRKSMLEKIAVYKRGWGEKRFDFMREMTLKL